MRRLCVWMGSVMCAGGGHRLTRSVGAALWALFIDGSEICVSNRRIFVTDMFFRYCPDFGLRPY